MMEALLAGLIVVTLVSILSGSKPMIATSVILFANWAINSAVCSYLVAHGDKYPYPYAVYMFNDYLSGLAIILLTPLWLERAPTRWQALVTLVYAAQLLWHTSFMWSDQGDVAKYNSWHFLYDTAWLQLILTGIWWYADTVHHHFRYIMRHLPLGKIGHPTLNSENTEGDQ